MSERNGYEDGVPCWVDTWRAEVATTAAFYAEVFGWETPGLEPGAAEQYVICKLHGRDVAAIGAPVPPAGARSPVGWMTYVWVEDAEGVARRVLDAGGSLLAEPFDSLDGGRMAIIADPAGAVLGAWQVGAHRGAELVNEPGAWSMSSLSTRQPERAAEFYSAVFGWETEAFGSATMFRRPGFVGGEPEQPVPRDVVAMMLAPDGVVPAEVPGHWGVDFRVDDVDAVAAKTVDLGGHVLSPPYEIPGVPMRQAVIADPDGAAISVTQLVVPA